VRESCVLVRESCAWVRCEDRVVPVVRSTSVVAAPPWTAAGVLRDAEAADEALGREGHGLTAPARLLAAGDEIRLAARVLPGVRIPVRTRITRVGEDGMASELAAGPFRTLVHDTRLTPAPAGTWVVDELRWTAPLGPLGRVADTVLIRRLARRLLAARAEVLAARGAQLGAAPVVVATALVRDRRVLVARRTRPPELAGRWELPGGRVEAGETEADAVVRECREELGTEVRVTGRVGTDLPIAAGVLRVHAAGLRPGAAEPRALEHAAVRWVGPDGLRDVDWVPADRAVVDDLLDLLVEQGEPAGAPPRL
jgi:8-oxo-dGTP diphosphatase